MNVTWNINDGAIIIGKVWFTDGNNFNRGEYLSIGNYQQSYLSPCHGPMSNN